MYVATLHNVFLFESILNNILLVVDSDRRLTNVSDSHWLHHRHISRFFQSEYRS